MLRYGFFDSEIIGYDEDGMPIFDRAESSDFLALFIAKIITDGVLALPGDCFQVVAYEGMKLKVRPGFGIVRGRFVSDTNEFAIEIPKAHTTLKRIDRVVLRANYPQRLCEIVIKEGTPSATPIPPDLLRPESGDFYELCLATIALNSNQTVITQTHITDTRYDSSVCGVVTQAIDHLDTAVFFAQLNSFYAEFVDQCGVDFEKFTQMMKKFEDEREKAFDIWFESIKEKLSTDVAVRLQNQIDGIKSQLGDSEGDQFSEEVYYEAGDYCIHKNALYKFTTDKEPGEWDETVVLRTSILAELKELFDALGGLKLRKISEQDYQDLPDKEKNTLYFSPKEG